MMLIFFLKPPKKEKETRPLIAEIVTPEQSPRQQREQEKITRSPRIRDKEPPKVMSQTPSRKSQKKKLGTAKDRQTPQKKPSVHEMESPAKTKQPIVIPPGYGVVRPKQEKSARDRLFDAEAIARGSQRASDKKEDDSITFDTKDFKYYGYMQRLREKIEYTWKYPAEASSSNIAGELYIRFIIKKNGQLQSADVVKTSGYRVLDDAAVRALRDAAPYWPLPAEWKRDDLTVTGRFVYTLQERRVR